MEPDTQDTPEEVLLKWFSNLRPLTLDIVGDFAGRELFVVHGESLLRYCLEDSQVDLEGTYAAGLLPGLPWIGVYLY